jgi:2-phospho-L-lactate/phosphoenolpyruvate guanylyltransferase
MPTVVIPFRGTDPKRRLSALPDGDRLRLAEAMLADVLAAAVAVGDVFVVAPGRPKLPAGTHHVIDPHRGLGAAVSAGLDAAAAAGAPGPYLVVNADVPCAEPRDLLALAGAVPADGLALVAAEDGTTNALAFDDGRLFEPLYGPGSAERFEALGPSLRVDAPNLVCDVDTLDDLARLALRVGPMTRAVLATVHLGAAA